MGRRFLRRAYGALLPQNAAIQMSKITVHVASTQIPFCGAADRCQYPPAISCAKFRQHFIRGTLVSSSDGDIRARVSDVDRSPKPVSAARKGAGFLGLPLDEFTEAKPVRKFIASSKNNNEHRIKEIDFDEKLVDWPDLINRAVQREPPFDPDLKNE